MSTSLQDRAIAPADVKTGRPNGRPQRLGPGRFAHVWFLAPAVLALLAIGTYPTIFALVTSFRQYNLARVRDGFPFVGFANYVSVLSDSSFWGTLLTTLRFFLTVMPVEIVLGFLIALLLHREGWGFWRVVARVSLVVPLATTYAVVGLVGRLLFNQNFGVLTQAFRAIGLDVDWLGSAGGAFAAIAIMDIWQWTPFCALIFLAGLTMVPGEIEEAAKLDRAGGFRLFWHIQLPFLLPGLTSLLILRSADILKLFDMIFTMTRGGPGAATELISIYIQRIGFRVFDLGTSSAQAILLLILTIVLSRLYIRFLYREVSA